ncbi:MAG: hypothetical protein R3264_00865 [Anaerolineae bacterium]|nr:hypothetical protein [Anaerolineae bacterium]
MVKTIGIASLIIMAIAVLAACGGSVLVAPEQEQATGSEPAAPVAEPVEPAVEAVEAAPETASEEMTAEEVAEESVEEVEEPVAESPAMLEDAEPEAAVVEEEEMIEPEEIVEVSEPEPAGPSPEQVRLLNGLDVLGQPPELENEIWLNSEPMKLADLHGKVVLVEFWTFG